MNFWFVREWAGYPSGPTDSKSRVIRGKAPRRSEASPRPLRGKEEAARLFYGDVVLLQSAVSPILVRFMSMLGVIRVEPANERAAAT
jgi:hypothetical protein